MTAKKPIILYSASGRAVWYRTSRVVCEADTDGMAQFIAAALNAYDHKAAPKQ